MGKFAVKISDNYYAVCQNKEGSNDYRVTDIRQKGRFGQMDTSVHVRLSNVIATINDAIEVHRKAREGQGVCGFHERHVCDYEFHAEEFEHLNILKKCLQKLRSELVACDAIKSNEIISAENFERKHEMAYLRYEDKVTVKLESGIRLASNSQLAEDTPYESITIMRRQGLSGYYEREGNTWVFANNPPKD